jgi:hypothetical protein
MRLRDFLETRRLSVTAVTETVSGPRYEFANIVRTGQSQQNWSEVLMSVLPVPNHDDQWTDFSGLYSKGLRQDHPGIPNPASYGAFISEVNRGIAAGPAVPITPPLFEPASGVQLGGTNRENGPQAAFAVQPFGGASPSFHTAVPPTLGDDDYAVELAELYWASLLRDVPFSQFVDPPANPLIKAAVDNLNNNLAHYRGPVDSAGNVTPRLLFRGGLPKDKRQAGAPAYFSDENVGPYVSQLCLVPTNLGAQEIDQKMQTFTAGQDFMVDPGEWFRVQQGLPTSRQITVDPTPRYMSDGRAFAAFTHQDELYQAYLVAYLVLNTLQLPPNPGSPYNTYVNQKPFGTFGGPDIVGTLGAVARAAINAVWFQKWAVNLRHRPEAGGGLVHLWKTGAAPLPMAAAAFSASFGHILEPALNASSARYSRPGATSNKDKIFLLSQAFPEGSPTHPAYPTGHGAVAGACITVLKFFFDCNRRILNFTQPVEPSEDGLDLLPYAQQDAIDMTFNGELHKLAHNISFGHGIHAGIHWRSDTDESLLFGEQVAILYLDKLVKTYAERVTDIMITLMDGTVKHFSN